jgi:cell division transport system permease protein
MLMGGVGLFARFGYNAFQVVQTLKQSIDIEVFLIDIDDNRKNRIESELLAYEHVSEITTELVGVTGL